MIVGKNILIISPEHWDYNKVSKHHYARTLSERGNNVFFLNPTNSRFRKKRIHSNLFSVDFPHHAKGIRWLGKWIRSLCIRRDFGQLEKSLGTSIDIIWNFDSSRFYDLSLIKSSVLRICHLVDLNQDFQRASLARSSDVCFGNSNPIIDILLNYNSRVFKINHGVKINSASNKLMNLPGSNRIKAVYSGNLDIKYLDIPLLVNLVKKHERVDFLFVGNYQRDNPLTKLGNSNVHLLGQMPSEALIDIYDKADLLLVIYDCEKYLLQLANPHKIMEYLASGKTVIATKTLEYLDSELIEMTSSREDFYGKFGKVIDNLDEYNNPQRRKKRIDFAMDNSYERQIERIEKILNTL